MPLTGDFNTLRRMQRDLDLTPEAIPITKQTVAPLFQQSAIDALQNGTTIGGRALGDKAATFKRGTSSPGVRSGALAGSLTSSPTTDGIRTAFAEPYAKYAVKGFFPKETPRNWLEMLQDCAIKAIAKVLAR